MANSKKKDKPTSKGSNNAKLPVISSPKLLDLLTKEVKKAGFSFERDGWTETIPEKDECGWLTIHLPWADDKRTEVHFYFDQNEQRLKEVSVWQRKRKWEEGEPELVSKDCL